MMYNENIETVNMSNLPIIYQLCRMAKIMEMVNAMVSWRAQNDLKNHFEISPSFYSFLNQFDDRTFFV